MVLCRHPQSSSTLITLKWVANIFMFIAMTNIFVLWIVHVFVYRQAHSDSVRSLGRGHMSGTLRVLHRRRLLHCVWIQRCHSAALVLEWAAPYHRRQPQQQWVTNELKHNYINIKHTALYNHPTRDINIRCYITNRGDYKILLLLLLLYFLIFILITVVTKAIIA